MWTKHEYHILQCDFCRQDFYSDADDTVSKIILGAQDNGWERIKDGWHCDNCMLLDRQEVGIECPS